MQGALGRTAAVDGNTAQLRLGTSSRNTLAMNCSVAEMGVGKGLINLSVGVTNRELE